MCVRAGDDAGGCVRVWYMYMCVCYICMCVCVSVCGGVDVWMCVCVCVCVVYVVHVVPVWFYVCLWCGLCVECVHFSCVK